ncbi:hypothetical protein Vadar_006459 [Vaccinium darrowii]|uniref:Uncharacterized protein n=1 Tax=Vaccinium darrowii TaxID=229202 RepID=A0ACB7Z9S7_9ERIC|nr:hypothetical protein Vadar_006459 [Vaccinium darrowii]
MAAKVGEAFLGAAVGKLVDCLASEEFINFFRENKQTTDSAVRRWLDELKDAVYHAEDLVDEIATMALRRKVEAEYPRGKKRFRDSLISTWNWLVGRGTNSNCEESHGLLLEGQGVSSVEKLEISELICSEEFASELVTLTNLKELTIRQCERHLSFPEGMMGLNHLKELSVWLCSVLAVPLSKEMNHCYMSLERLDLFECESLKSLPLGLFPKLRFLNIGECKNFETLLIPDGIEHQSLTLLERLDIQYCSDMFFFPRGGFSAPNLSDLWLSGCKKLKALPEQMHTLLPSLRSLDLWGCPEIESFPEGGLPSNLIRLEISNCKKLVGCRRDWGLQTLPSLANFVLIGESEDVLESFPEEGLLPSTLTILRIADLPNLKSLNKRGLQHLGSLKTMKIENCPRLQSLPEEGLQFLGSLKSMDIRNCQQLQSLPKGLPPNLFGLQIVDCPLLKASCRREEGTDWHKIAHVPLINIDGEAIFDQPYLGRVDPKDFWI